MKTTEWTTCRKGHPTLIGTLCAICEEDARPWRKCPHCLRETKNVTCTRSECQEAEFIANRERNAARRKKKS